MLGQVTSCSGVGTLSLSSESIVGPRDPWAVGRIGNALSVGGEEVGVADGSAPDTSGEDDEELKNDAASEEDEGDEGDDGTCVEEMGLGQYTYFCTR